MSIDSLWPSLISAASGLLGVIIGAGMTFLSQRSMFSRQRREEISKVTDAVRTEVTAYAKYVMGAIEMCQQIAGGTVHIPMQDAGYIVKSLVDPMVYPAVVDRIGLLPHPHATTEFYMRLAEARAMCEAVRTKAAPAGTLVTSSIAAPLADSLITALQLARPIVANEGASSGRSQLAALVQTTVVRQIDECLKSAQTTFPRAESFQTPPSS